MEGRIGNRVECDRDPDRLRHAGRRRRRRSPDRWRLLQWISRRSRDAAMVRRADVRAAHTSSHRSHGGAFATGGGEELSVNALSVPARSGVLSTSRDYISLLKLRIVLLLDATAIGVMIPAAHGHPRVEAVLAVFAGGTLAAGGAHAINCWFDRDIDAEMTRTRLRPLPAGRIPPWHALALGIAFNVLAFGVLWAYANLLAAGLALAGTLIYVFVYTIWLKRSTPQNIVIGGAAGAVPPLVGWAAA